MKTIAYYISDYGYGHATRSIAVIRELLSKTQNLKFIICHSFALPFLKASLRDERVAFRKVETDIGFVLKQGSVHPDIKAMIERYKVFSSNFPNIDIKEYNFIKNEKVDLVISDISPLPFSSAAQLGIPSIAVSNFTWYIAYQGLFPEKLLESLGEKYEKIDYFFYLGGSEEPLWGRKDNENFSFYSRKIDPNEVKKIRRSLGVSKEKKLVFVGIGMKINELDIDVLPLWDNSSCVFIVSSNIKVDRENVFSIPPDYLESQNYIGASDIIITKPGWGTVGEAIQANKPLLLIDRKDMNEDQNTIKYLRNYNRCSTIQWEEFCKFKISKAFIEKLEAQQLMGQLNSSITEVAESILEIAKVKN